MTTGQLLPVSTVRARRVTPGIHVAAYPFLTLAIGLLAFVLAAAAAPTTGFNPDESRWLARAHYLGDLGDPFGPTWADQYMTRGQPPLGSYAMGLALLLQGRDLETNPPWDFSRPWEENIALGMKPSAADLTAGRRASAFCVALTTLCLIVIAHVFVSAPWSLIAGALFAVHPFTTYIGSLAMSDALLGLLIALAATAAAAFARRPGWARALLVGSLLGLGGATKLSPLGVALAIFGAASIALFIAALRQRHFPVCERLFAFYAAVTLAAACITFVAVYPYLWPDPLVRTQHLFAFRAMEMATQAADWPEMAVPTRMEAMRRLGLNFSERYNLATSLASHVTTSPPAPLRHIEIALALFGMVLMISAAIRAGPYAPSTLAFAVLGGQAVLTILGMRSEFDRYHLPTALLGVVAVAVALEWLARAALAACRRSLGWRANRTPGEAGCGS